MRIWIVGPIAWDSVLFLDSSFTETGYTHIRKRSERPGGQGLNVTAGLRSADLDVQLVGYLGDDANAEKIIAANKEIGINFDHVTTFPGPTPHVMVLVDRAGERKMIGLEASKFEMVRIPRDQIKTDDIVIWTWWREEFKDDFLSCKNQGATTVVGLAALSDSTVNADIYIGSSIEVPTEKPPADKKVIITKGAEGATYFHLDRRIEIPAKSVEVIDTTGAGDALLAGVIYGIANGLDVEKSLSIGVNWSAATISNESSLPAAWSEKYIIG